jgi:ribosome-binding factor A
MRRSETPRAKRLSDAILREVSLILLEEIKDPRLELVSISGVRLNKDMSIAEVLFTHGGGQEKREEVQKGLDTARGFIRTQLGKRLNLRRTPELRFMWDEFLEVMVYGRSGGPESPDHTDDSGE